MLGILGDIWDAVKSIYLFVVGAFSDFLTNVSGFITYIKDGLVNVYDSIVDLLKDSIDFLKYLFDLVSNLYDSTVDFFKDIIPIIIDNTVDFIVAAFNLIMDTCSYCYNSLIDGFHSSVSVLVNANTFTETAYYCLYRSDVDGALALISCGVTIWLFRKTIALVTLGFIRI